MKKGEGEGGSTYETQKCRFGDEKGRKYTKERRDLRLRVYRLRVESPTTYQSFMGRQKGGEKLPAATSK